MGSVRLEDADGTKRGQRQRRGRVPVGLAVFAACMGSIAFFSVAGNARFEAYHTLDVIRLMTAGAGFGVAFIVLIQFFRFSGPHSDGNTE